MSPKRPASSADTALTSEIRHGASHAPMPHRLAWLPIPLLLAAMAVLWAVDVRAAHESTGILLLLRVFFVLPVSLGIAGLVAYSFMANGEGRLLMLGCGVLFWGLASTLAPFYDGQVRFIHVTVHNLGAWCAAVCHLGGLLWGGRVGRPGRWLAAGYAAVLTALGLLIHAAMAGWVPVFFVQGEGGTPIRQFVLGSAIVMFSLAAFLMLRINRRQPASFGSAFPYWYGWGLMLLAVGLSGVMMESVHGSPLCWTGRAAQFLGSVYMLAAAVVAVSETGAWRVSLAAALRASEDRYRSLVELSPEAIIVHQDGCFVYANPAAVRLFGATDAAELIGRPVIDSVHPDDHGLTRSRMALALDGERPPLEEMRALRLDGRCMHVESTGAPIDFEGRPAVQVVIRDITGRKQTEKTLEAALRAADEERRKLSAVFEALPLGLVITDQAGGVLRTNDRDAEIWGERPPTRNLNDYVQYKAWWADTGKPIAPTEWASAQSVQKGETITGQMLKIQRFDGQYRFVLNSAAPIYDSAGRILGSVIAIQDVTALRQAEDALRDLNATLEHRVVERTVEVRRQAEQLRALASKLSQAEQRERKRLAKILHDHIQQLIVAARMQVEWLKSDTRPERVLATAQGVEGILNEALTASRSLTVELSPPVLHDAGLIGGLNWLAARMREKNQFTVNLRSDNTAEPATEAVRFLLFECARELLFNAVKHADIREADVTLVRASGGEIKLIVQDKGKGFDPDVVRNRHSDEVSFGLFSIQERLAFIGGRMEIESAPARGTRITLAVPDGEAQQAAEETMEYAPGQDRSATIKMRRKPNLCRVLIVDDHRIMREGIAGLLQFASDIEVIGEAADGPRAIELAAELAPDVVIMDVNLGEMDGVEATRRIFAENPAIKMIGLSMHIDKDVAAAMRDAGAIAYLTKGGPSSDLIDVIRSCAAQNLMAS